MREVEFTFSDYYHWRPNTDLATLPGHMKGYCVAGTVHANNTDGAGLPRDVKEAEAAYENMTNLVWLEEYSHRSAFLPTKLRMRMAWLEFLSTCEFIQIIDDARREAFKLLAPLGRNLDIPSVPVAIRMRIKDIMEASKRLNKYRRACEGPLEALAVDAIAHSGLQEFAETYLQRKFRKNPAVGNIYSALKSTLDKLENEVGVVVTTPLIEDIFGSHSTPFYPGLSIYESLKELNDVDAISRWCSLIIDPNYMEKMTREADRSPYIDRLAYRKNIRNCLDTVKILMDGKDYADIIHKVCFPLFIPEVHDIYVSQNFKHLKPIELSYLMGQPSVFIEVDHIENEAGHTRVKGRFIFSGPREHEDDYFDMLTLTGLKYWFLDRINLIPKIERDRGKITRDSRIADFLQTSMDVSKSRFFPSLSLS